MLKQQSPLHNFRQPTSALKQQLEKGEKFKSVKKKYQIRRDWRAIQLITLVDDQNNNYCKAGSIKNRMCFSDSKVNSRQIKDNFKQMVEQRSRYTKEKDFSQFVICMVEYMEKILQNKVGIRVTEEKSILRCLPCYSDDSNYRNVRREFQKSYESCSSREQLQYYGKFINLLIGNKSISAPFAQPKMTMTSPDQVVESIVEEQIFFDVEIKGKITWTSGYQMKLISQKSSILLKSLSEKQTLLNLRNYIFRESKLARDNSYVLIGIVPIEPYKLKFSIASENPNRMKIIGKIKQLADKALEQNVNYWKQPVSHISSARDSQGGNKKNVANLFDKNKPKQQSPTKSKEARESKFNKMKDINNPLKNIILDKAKAGMIKKTMQYIDNLDEKRDRLSQNNLSQNNPIRQTNRQSSKDQVQDLRGWLSAKQNKSDEIIAMKDNPFTKKPNPSPSYMSAREPEVNNPQPKASTKRIPQNYAQQPEDTRSDSHVQQYEREKLKKANVEGESDKVDSGKSLIDDIEQIILEQEQFGNLSEISHDTDLSFQTIPEPAK